MPNGTYIDATRMGVMELATEINDIIEDQERYFNFFKWKNHYTYHYPEESYDSDPMCKLCEAISNETMMKNYTVIDDFQEWWNEDDNILLQT